MLWKKCQRDSPGHCNQRQRFSKNVNQSRFYKEAVNGGCGVMAYPLRSTVVVLSFFFQQGRKLGKFAESFFLSLLFLFGLFALVSTTIIFSNWHRCEVTNLQTRPSLTPWRFIVEWETGSYKKLIIKNKKKHHKTRSKFKVIYSFRIPLVAKVLDCSPCCPIV